MGKRKGRRPAAKSRGGRVRCEPPPVSETEEEAEGEGDFCFVCKDGGDLRLCDYRNCHKAYHAHCAGKDEDFLKSDEDFICRWHTCFICNGPSYFRCLCCPGNSVCRGCLRQAEFVQVGKQTKGFCTNCLKMAIMIEKNIEVDSDGEKVDFSDKTTFEFLFKDYWEIVKEKEGLTLDNLQEAHSSLDNSPNGDHVSDSEIFAKEHSSDDDFLGNIDDGNDEPILRLSNANGASNKVKALRKQGKSKKNVYVGWGSKELIEFLASIGKDISVSLDQFGAAEAVREYIRQKDLLQKDKKKRMNEIDVPNQHMFKTKCRTKNDVICDKKLEHLFRKKNIRFTKIYSLLERHIAANATSEDETLASSEDNSDSCRKKKTRTMTSESSTSKEYSDRIRRCFASLVRGNIKLVYLRRSLVMDLLKQPEAFENKVIGCFVRVKNDPKDYYSRSKTMYQLGQVTGIRKSSEEYTIRGVSTNMLLSISSCWSEVKISMLSDEDFEEDECEHLRLLVKKEHSKRHTVAEFEEKARNVHRDIVNHWIDKELERLEKLIEVANEKGWRYEMHEYIEKRRLLRTPSERQRLLEEVPRVIPDLEDSKDTELLIAASDKSFQINTSVLQGANGERAVCLESCSGEISKGAHRERAICLESCSEEISKGANKERAPCLRSCSEDKSEGANEKAVRLKSFSEIKSEGPNERVVCFKSWSEENPKATVADAYTPETRVPNQAIAVKSNAAGDTPPIDVQNQDSKDNTASDRLGMHVQKQGTEANAAGITPEVIIIDDDEDDATHDEGTNMSVADLDADKSWDTRTVQQKTRYTCLWCYMDPQDDERGPFTMEVLRGWKEQGYFDDDFRVWREGESIDSAILLTQALLLER